MEARQQLTMQVAPYAGHLPVPKTPPPCYAGTAAHFLRQHLPGNAGQQHEHDPSQAARSETRGRPPLEALRREGAEIAVVALGAAGSLVTDGQQVVRTGIRPVDVVDTTGAGDTFIAGFVSRRLDCGSLQQCLEAGRDAAADACTYFGGFPQTPRPFC
jgi:sugar/nucleoside kinase (ribokinase family)